MEIMPYAGESADSTISEPDIYLSYTYEDYLAWTTEERFELIKGGVFRMGAPDIVVEVISAGNSKKKLWYKFEVYQQNGVKEYWIIFPGERIVTVHTLSDAGVYSGPEYFTEEDTLTTPLLPGFEVALIEIFN